MILNLNCNQNFYFVIYILLKLISQMIEIIDQNVKKIWKHLQALTIRHITFWLTYLIKQHFTHNITFIPKCTKIRY